MKHIALGQNELYFSLLRDLPYYQPTTNYFGITVRSLDTDVTKTFVVRDVSSSVDSYQLFYVTGTTASESLNDAVVSMLPYGMWYAEVHDATGSTTSDVTSTVLWRGMITSSEE